MSHNEVTGDEIKSKVNTKEYEDNYDRIFKRKPQSLDAAYERRAMMQGLITSPLFDENKEMIEEALDVDIPYEMEDNEYLRYCHGREELWPDTEERMDVIGQNGNNGEHYKENED